MNEISIFDFLDESKNYAFVPFFKNGREVFGAKWGITLKSAGSMRFRWNEKNENREKIIREILRKISKCSGSCSSGKGECDCKKSFSPVELIHSKIVFESNVPNDTFLKKGDGVATKNAKIVPAVTVADCVPIFLFDSKTGAKAALHSGWKGTGIAKSGVDFLCEKFGAEKSDILAAIGPHICRNCYEVDEERRGIFANDFGKKSVFGKCLDLTEANIFVLKQAGIPESNITISKECTCCSKIGGEFAFGSFRRESAFLPDATNEEKSRAMTVQAAFVFSM